MHHTVCFGGTVASAVEYDLPAINDGILPIQNGHFLPASDLYLRWAAPIGLLLNYARMVTPTFRQLTSPYLRPINLAALPVDMIQAADYIRRPLRIKALEELQVIGFNSANTSGNYYVPMALSLDSGESAPIGDVYTMRGIGTTTVVAGAWTLCAITWQDSLPQGMYSVVGLNSIGATCIASRLVFQNQYWRPGCVGTTLVSDRPATVNRDPRMGIWGKFPSNAMPQFETLCDAADTAQEVYVDFVRTG